MIKIYSDDHLIYAPSVTNNGYDVLTAKLTGKLNAAQKLVMTIPPSNPNVGEIEQMVSEIRVYDGEDRVLRGRVLSGESNFYGVLKVTVESDLAYLNDVILRPYTYDSTNESDPLDRTGARAVKKYLAFLLNKYNAKAPAERQFVLGNVTVTNDGLAVKRDSDAYPTVWDEINEQLIGMMGGYVSTRCEVENNVEVTYLDYTATSGSDGDQVIRFAENILDLSQNSGVHDLFTVVIPFGGTPEGADDPVGIYGVIGWDTDHPSTAWPYDYIANATAVATYGTIERRVDWDDITDGLTLWKKAYAAVMLGATDTDNITVKALDLEKVGVDTDRLRLGWWYKVISAPHDLTDATIRFQLSQMTANLLKPSDSQYTFGAVLAPLSRRVAALQKGGKT